MITLLAREIFVKFTHNVTLECFGPLILLILGEVSWTKYVHNLFGNDFCNKYSYFFFRRFCSIN
jgi:hypothetical protein